MIETYYKENRKQLLKRIAGRGIRKDLVEDVLQESFTRALTFYHAFDKKRNFGSWFNTIMNNCIKDAKREDKMEGMVSSEEVYDPTTSEDLEFNSLLCKRLEKELEGRSKHTKDILYLYFKKNMKPSEISQIVEANNKAVRMAIYRFKLEMREKYGESTG